MIYLHVKPTINSTCIINIRVNTDVYMVKLLDIYTCTTSILSVWWRYVHVVVFQLFSCIHYCSVSQLIKIWMPSTMYMFLIGWIVIRVQIFRRLLFCRDLRLNIFVNDTIIINNMNKKIQWKYLNRYYLIYIHIQYYIHFQ